MGTNNKSMGEVVRRGFLNLNITMMVAQPFSAGFFLNLQVRVFVGQVESASPNFLSQPDIVGL